MSIPVVWRALVLMVCALLGSCATTAPELREGDRGAALKEVLPGTWLVENQIDGLTVAMTKTYRRDGTAYGELRIGRRKPMAGIVMPFGRFESRWRIEGDVLVIYDIRCTNRELFAPDEVHHDRIISVSANRFVYKDWRSGERVISVRRAY